MSRLLERYMEIFGTRLPKTEEEEKMLQVNIKVHMTDIHNLPIDDLLALATLYSGTKFIGFYNIVCKTIHQKISDQ